MNERDEREMTVIKERVSWDDFEEFLTLLSQEFDMNSFSGVYGPARGGVTLAATISNRYNLPYLGAPQKGCLIVDDIVDSGKTAEAWFGKGYTIATMYYEKNASLKPNFWWKEKSDKWIIFPWE